MFIYKGLKDFIILFILASNPYLPSCHFFVVVLLLPSQFLTDFKA